MQNKLNHIYTAQEIRDYLNGNLSNEQMQLIEKAALDDEFLAEAIEGFKNDSSQSSLSKLNELTLEINKKASSQHARIVPLTSSPNRSFPLVAAVFIAIAFCTVLYFLLFNKKDDAAKDNTLAKNDVTTSSTLSNDSGSLTNPVYSDTANAYKPLERNDGKASVSIPRSTASTNTSSKAAAVKEQVLAMNKTADQSGQPTLSASSPVSNLAYDSSNARMDVAMNQVNENGRAKKQGIHVRNVAQADISKLLFAQILGPDNSPVPFARINILNNKIGTYADAKGNVVVASVDSTLLIEVKSIGYLTKYFNLTGGSASKIILQEDKNSFSNDVEITSSDVKPKFPFIRGRFIRDSVQNVEPADGWDLYGSYVDNNIELPEEVIKNQVKGTVEISFEVKKNGDISNAKVDKSLCENCDEEALRLIRQGPQWKSKGGKKARSKIKVQF